MDLLPKSSEEFSSQSYWDAFFSKRKLDPFEWYGEYPELAGLLHKYISPKDHLLIVGCGNSTLSYDLHTAGIQNQTSLDISSVVVSQMKKKYPHIDFIEGDVTDMKFTGTPFSCVFDKGTFDALSPPPASVRKNRNKTEFHETEDDTKINVDLMLEEINRVLKPGGRFICISLLQPHVAERLISYFYNLGWMTRVVRCLDAENKTAEKNSDDKSVVFPVFMTIFTKLNLPSGTKPILEASSPSNVCTMTRFSELSELTAFVKDQQNFALIKRGLLQLGFCAEKGLQMQLSNSTTGEDRFIINVVDVPKLLNNPMKQRFGVFVVPQGRETEWLFGTHEGRTSLAIQANFARLVVVHLIRGQIYQDMNSIQQEVKGVLATLKSSCVGEGIKAPIMTMGDDVGNRIIVHQGRSEFSGAFVIEDVSSNGKILRRLIFLNSPNIIQSEVEIAVVKKRGKEFHNPVTSKLSCQHHGLMMISIGFLNYFFKKNEVKSSPISTLLIGLGGGMFSLFLINVIPNLNLEVVEIDPEIVTAAKKYFGLPEQKERLSVIVDDGLKFIQSTESQYNIILIDVDNKSTKEGLSCPPPDFLEPSTLANYKKSMKSDGSILVINLVCRNLDLKKYYFNVLQQQFPFILQCDVPSELNTLLFCFLKIPDADLKNISTHINSCIQLICPNEDNVNATCKKHPNSKRKTALKKNTLPQPHTQSLPVVDHFDGAFEDVDTIANSFKILKI